MRFEKSKQKVFTTQKTHTQKARLRTWLEIIIIIFVAAGSIFSLLKVSQVSPGELFAKVKNAVLLKTENKDNQKEISFEEKITSEIDGKILNITAIEKITEHIYKIKSQEGIEVILTSEKSIKSQSGTLQTLLTKAKIDNKVISSVDFRFNKLVVRYGQ